MPVKLLGKDTLEFSGPLGQAYIRYSESLDAFAVDTFGTEPDTDEAYIDSESFPSATQACEYALACTGVVLMSLHALVNQCLTLEKVPA